MQPKSRGLLAIAVSLIATAALAQTSATPPAATGTAPAQGMPMMAGQQMVRIMAVMRMIMGQNAVAEHVEGRIAFLKTELKITDAQQPLWNAFADAMRANAKEMTDMMPMMQSMMPMMQSVMPMMPPSGTLPEKLAAREKIMTAHLDVLRKLRAAVEPLYVTLNDDQKKTADELIIGPMGAWG